MISDSWGRCTCLGEISGLDRTTSGWNHLIQFSVSLLDKEGLVWPGVDGPVTNCVARSLRLGDDYVYVEDSVLADFEGRPEFSIYRESGSVGHGTQWSVSGVRVGRNLKSVFTRRHALTLSGTGTGSRWHRCRILRIPAILHEANIAKRAKDITFAVGDRVRNRS